VSGRGGEWPERQDLRSWLRWQAERGRLGVVSREVNPEFELAGVLARLDGRRAVLFERIAGSDLRVAGNTVLERADLAAAMGCAIEQAPAAFDEARREPAGCRVVDPGEAPVLATRVESDGPLATLPIPVHHERDAGRYLSAGVVISRDPSAGATNLSIHRFQVTGGSTMRALILPGRMSAIVEEAEAAGRPLELGIAIGVDPLLTLATQARAPRDVDELEVCSALRASPLAVVQAPSLDLRVPAEAELLIEAVLRPGERESEGPFGEFPRTYSPAAPGPVLDVLAVWRRQDAIFQTILSSGLEHLLVGGLPREADLLRELRRLEPAVTQVRMTEGGSCRLHAVVSLAGAGPGQGVEALHAAFSANPVLKHVVVVDDDVDVFDDMQVEWALATRVQADRDVVILPEVRGSSLDPSAEGGITAKLGVDATVGGGARDSFARIRVPGAERLDIDSLVQPASTGPS
jgi:2,5-furandicarboxylate decarboxylase 1